MWAEAELFKAVAHPVRATILELLSQGEFSIPQVCERTGVKPSHLSRHLAQMRAQQLIPAPAPAAAWSIGWPTRGRRTARHRPVRPSGAGNSSSQLTWSHSGGGSVHRSLGERMAAPETTLVSRSLIADACQAIAERTGCTTEAAAGRLIMTARTCHMTLLEAAPDELRSGQVARTD